MKERVEKVKAYATVMADKYLFARQKLAILEPLTSEEITKLFDRSYGAHAHNALALTLILDIVRDICAFTLDKDERSASLVNIWRLLGDAHLRTALKDVATSHRGSHSVWSKGLTPEERAAWKAEIEAEDAHGKSIAFDEAYARVERCVPDIAESEMAAIFKIARDKALAHYEMRAGRGGYELFDLGSIGLKWGSPREFLDRLDRVVWDVVLVATWGSYDEEGFEKSHRLFAADFWARLQGKPPIKGD